MPYAVGAHSAAVRFGPRTRHSSLYDDGLTFGDCRADGGPVSQTLQVTVTAVSHDVMAVQVVTGDHDDTVGEPEEDLA